VNHTNFDRQNQLFLLFKTAREKQKRNKNRTNSNHNNNKLSNMMLNEVTAVDSWKEIMV